MKRILLKGEESDGLVILFPTNAGEKGDEGRLSLLFPLGLTAGLSGKVRRDGRKHLFTRPGQLEGPGKLEFEIANGYAVQ